jgi:hypothetical protein
MTASPSCAGLPCRTAALRALRMVTTGHAALPERVQARGPRSLLKQCPAAKSGLHIKVHECGTLRGRGIGDERCGRAVVFWLLIPPGWAAVTASAGIARRLTRRRSCLPGRIGFIVAVSVAFFLCVFGCFMGAALSPDVNLSGIHAAEAGRLSEWPSDPGRHQSSLAGHLSFPLTGRWAWQSLWPAPGSYRQGGVRLSG